MNNIIESITNSSKELLDSTVEKTTSIANDVVDSAKNLSNETLALGTVISSGTAATVAGVVAAGTSTTAAISAVGSAVGGVVGGVVGSGVGLASGGIGMAATVPFAAAGSAIGGYAGTAAALLGIGTAPAWAVPVAVAGGVVTTGALAVAAYKRYTSKDNDDISTEEAENAVAILSEKQLKEIAELEVAHIEGFYSDVDFEEKMKRITSVK
jgi:hypothetical protein